jgi:hypothetical protein
MTDQEMTRNEAKCVVAKMANQEAYLLDNETIMEAGLSLGENIFSAVLDYRSKIESKWNPTPKVLEYVRRKGLFGLWPHMEPWQMSKCLEIVRREETNEV